MGIAQVLKRSANRLGYDVRRISPGGAARVSISQTYALLSARGLEPASVIDVGVAYGTPELYRAFPKAHFLLVEPVAAFEPDMRSALRRVSGRYVMAAAGPTNGTATFNVHDSYLGGSSLLKDARNPNGDGRELTVPMVRLDDVGADLLAPMLLKVDVQGAEIDVLEGAPHILQQCEVVVLEASLFRFMKGQPDFHDVVVYMKARGFVVYDIIHVWNRPLDNALGQVDLVFVKEHGRFRQS